MSFSFVIKSFCSLSNNNSIRIEDTNCLKLLRGTIIDSLLKNKGWVFFGYTQIYIYVCSMQKNWIFFLIKLALTLYAQVFRLGSSKTKKRLYFKQETFCIIIKTFFCQLNVF